MMCNKNILFISDLDNTLIHSHKCKSKGDICIEWLNDREQSYVTLKTAQLLKKVSNYVNFIPITTRSIVQYSRIEWNKLVFPEYAVTTNGGVLLQCKGNSFVSDKSWRNIILERVISADLPELEKMYERISVFDGLLSLRIVDESYLFAHCIDNEAATALAEKCRAVTKLRIDVVGRKVYLLPQMLNKGTAVKWLKEMLRPDYIIVAGDSVMDIPMLECADMAIVPEQLKACCLRNKKVCPSDTCFSEFILEQVGFIF